MDIIPVSYTHLDVYKRQADGGGYGVGFAFAYQACSVGIYQVLQDAGSRIVTGDEARSEADFIVVLQGGGRIGIDRLGVFGHERSRVGGQTIPGKIQNFHFR